MSKRYKVQYKVEGSPACHVREVFADSKAEARAKFNTSQRNGKILEVFEV